MLAAILREPGIIDIREVETPEPSEGELLIKVKAALTCGTDLKAFVRGHSLIPMPGPFGHEFSGIITAKGKGTGKFKTGDAVMAVHSAPCLDCSYCRSKLFNLCENLMSTKVLGAFAEYILVPRHIVRQNVFKKPDGLSFKEASFLEPLACVVHGMEPLKISKGETVFIIGAGPIGLLHLMLAKSKGAKVLITDIGEERLRSAKKSGADLVFQSPESTRCVRDFTGGTGADYVFECTGRPEIWESTVNYVRRGGAVVLFGGCKAGTIVKFSADRLHYDEITLRGTFHFTPRDVKKSFLLLKNREIGVKKLISGTYPLKETGDAFSELSRGIGIKYAIVP